MSNKDKAILLAIASFVFLLCYSFFSFKLETLFDPSGHAFKVISVFNENPWLRVFTRTAFSLITFSFIFNMMMRMYFNTKLYSWINPSQSIDGDYVYIFDDQEIDCCIFGFFHVRHVMGNIQIVQARCWYGGTENLKIETERGSWKSNWTCLDDNDFFWMCYTMEISNNYVGNNEKSYQGVMKLKIYDDPEPGTKALAGKLCDYDAFLPHAGRIVAKRLLSRDARKMKRLKSWNNLHVLFKEYFPGRDIANDVTCQCNKMKISEKLPN